MALVCLVGLAGAAAATADTSDDPAATGVTAPTGVPAVRATASGRLSPTGLFAAAANSVRVFTPATHHPRGHHRRLRELAPRHIGRILARQAGWTGSEWTCLDALWTRESNWSIDDTNARSGAYGIPQALPADKMATIAADWRDNPVTQIRWGLHYIDVRYGSPCAAWTHSQEYDYY